MAVHGESELIDNFIVELQPYLALIDQAVGELARPAPDVHIVNEAIESLAIIRDASHVLAFSGLITLTSALEDAITDLVDATTPDPDHLLVRARAMAAGIHRYMNALADGQDTNQLIARVMAPFENDQASAGTDAVGPNEREAGNPAGVAMLDPGTFLINEADPELREIFEEEATDLIASFTRGALMLVSAPDRPSLLTGLRRDAHTLKGAANMTGFPLIGSIGGSVETLLDAHIDGNVPVERETLGVVLSARKLLTGMLANLDDLGAFVVPAQALNERAATIYTAIAPVASITTASVHYETVDDLVIEQPVVVTESIESTTTSQLVTEDWSIPDADVVDEPVATLDDLLEEITTPPVQEAGEDTSSAWAALAGQEQFSYFDTLAVPLEPYVYQQDGIAEHEAHIDEPAFELASPEITPAVEPDAVVEEPELDVYEMAAEIAMLARLRTSLQPQNAMFFPTDASDLTNDIDALTAEIVENIASDTPLPATTDDVMTTDIVVEPTAPDAATDLDILVQIEPSDLERIPTPSRSSSLTGMAMDEERLGHALLDLVFDGTEPASVIPPMATGNVISDEQMQDALRETFAAEAAEHADSLTLAAMALERDPEQVDALRELARVLHTLKGAAGAAGFDAIGARCHEIEDTLAAGADINRDFTNRVMALASEIERATTSADATADTPADDDFRPEPTQTIAQSSGDLRVDMRRLDGLLNLVGELVINRSTLDQRLLRLSASLDELTHMTERLRRSGQTLERVAGEASLFGPLPAPGDDRVIPFAGHDLRHEFDTLEMDRYTDLDVLARELGEVASDIGAVAGEVRNLRGDFETVSTHQRRLTNDIQDELMGIRMVPLATLTPLLHRVVRRVAHECGKDVDLIIEGSEIAFDKALVDALGDALLHLLRNAVDHGIEAPALRSKTGKPEHGQIVVRAWQDRGNAVVEVIDDGGGVDSARLVERARSYGFITAEHVSEAEALQLMFLPGFSTRDSASSVSGRGVGLDAVREAVERVKGRVTVDTKPGAGTIFQLRLPVMLAVAQAFLVEAGGRRYAIPLADVDFVADRRQAKLSRVGSATLVEINETIIPAIDLASRLAGDPDRLDEETGWLLITRAGGEPRAMRVDVLHGQQEIVVKSLGRYLSAAPGVTGATILGDGQLALIIDVTEVTSKRAMTAPAAEVTEPTPIDSVRAGVGTVLIVDDSLSVRRVLARTIERHGWTALQAHDGVEALSIIQNGGIDIVVTDIEMPRLDGFELINSLRRGGWQTLPIVVLTSRSSSKHRDKALELGANAYIVKPFQEQELIQTLERETIAIRVAG